MRNCSEFTFSDFMKGDFSFVKVTWNGLLLYDDIDGDMTLDDFDSVYDILEDKIFYEVKVTIVDFHHCTLDFIGEDLPEKEKQVFVKKKTNE